MIAASRRGRQCKRCHPPPSGPSKLRAENSWLSRRLPAFREKTGKPLKRSFANRLQPACALRWRSPQVSRWREPQRPPSRSGPAAIDRLTVDGLANLVLRDPLFALACPHDDSSPLLRPPAPALSAQAPDAQEPDHVDGA